MTLRILVVAWLLLLPAGCGRESQPAPAQAAAETAPREPDAQAPARPSPDAAPRTDQQAEESVSEERATPSAIVRRVNELRRAGRLSEMAQHVVTGRRAAVVGLVRAVDQLLLDNRVLVERIKASGAQATSTLFDRPAAANIIDVFSHDVEIIREQTDGDSAEVTVQVGQRLPLSVVRMTRLDGHWLIVPDPPIPGLADEIRNLGKCLRRVAQAVERRDMTVEQINKELRLWQTPVLRRIEKLIKEARHGQS